MHVELAAHRQPGAATLVRLRRQAVARDIDLADYALLLDRLGRRDEAFAWLRRIRVDRFELAMLRIDPRLDTFRTDPRFARILRAS